ncbi:flagellar hook assembly protein FlgD [Microbacterium sp.]|uniref:flagellar hook assembly protein FlgD n=1 Tax=Microbacterium sp. TaxID=51671 RepID=UPI003A8D934F
MTTIDPVAASGTAAPAQGLYTGTTAPAVQRKQTLDSDVFLKLLVTQLANQDPSSPMNTNEMIAQTTQLASMERLTSLATTTSESFALNMRQAAAALMGQQAQYNDADGTPHSGTVTAVSFAGPVPTVTIGDATVPLDTVSGLSTSTS